MAAEDVNDIPLNASTAGSKGTPPTTSEVPDSKIVGGEAPSKAPNPVS